MNQSSVKYYHTNDPLENFKIRVIVRETSRLQMIDEKGMMKSDSRPLYYNTSILDWQEKHYGPREITTYIKNKGTHLHISSKNQPERLKDAFRNLEHYEKENKKGAETIIDDVMLYTYVDKDHFHPNQPSKVMDRYRNISSVVNYLGVSLGGNISNDKPGVEVNLDDKRKLSIQQRLRRDFGQYKEMYICLATDVDVPTLKSGSAIDPLYHYNEHILCWIRYYESGLMEISPGLSEVMEESIDGTVSGKTVTIASNLSDDTIIQGIKQGFRLATFRLRSNNGSDFEYAIENMNEVFAPQLLDEILMNQILNDSQALAINRNLDSSESDGEWKQDPPPKGYDNSCTYYAELVSGYGFEHDNCYVSYEVILPSHWQLRTGNLTDGVAEQDFAKGFNGNSNIDEAGAVIGLKYDCRGYDQNKTARDILLNDGFLDGSEAEGILQGVTSTVRAGSFQLNGIYLSKHKPKWKGHSFSSILPFPSRLLIGISFFIYTMFALIMGFDYPFWVLTALVIFVTLYSGMPGAPAIQVAAITNKKQKQSRGVKGRELLGSYLVQDTMHFNHLLNLSFDVKSLPIAVLAGQASSPTILFQVFSVGWFNRHRLEGYGYVTLPETAGCFDLDIKTWKPRGGMESNMRDHFLGCSPHLRETSYVYIPNVLNSGLNKFGVSTEPSGSLRFRCNVLVTDLKYSRKFKLQQKSLPGSDGNKTTAAQTLKQLQVRQTVEEILQSYRSISNLGRLSRNASISRSGMLTQIPGRSTSVISSLDSSRLSSSMITKNSNTSAIVDTLTANDRADRVAQILALAKAKLLKAKTKDLENVKDASTVDKNTSNGNNSENNSGAENDSTRINQSLRQVKTEINGGLADGNEEESEPLISTTPIITGQDFSRSNTGSSLDSSVTRIQLPIQIQNISTSNRKGSVRYPEENELEEDSVRLLSDT